MRHIRITSVGSDGTRPESWSMTGISVQFTETEASDWMLCYTKALDFIVSELKRYALEEALRGIGIRPPVSKPESEVGRRHRLAREGAEPM